MRTVQVIGALLLMLLIGMAVQHARVTARQQPLASPLRRAIK